MVKNKRIGIALIIVLGVVAIMVIVNKTLQTDTGIFSWKSSAMNDRNSIDFVKEQQFSEIYQLINEKESDESVCGFLKKMAENETAVYLLSGESDWYLDGSAQYMMHELDRVNDYNRMVSENEKIKGVVFDIEPYNVPGWSDNKQKMMQSMIGELAKVYSKKGNLEMMICIPFYYDTMGLADELESLVRDCCDGVMVMNYSVGNEVDNIKKEMELCKKYQRRLVNIYEFQPRGVSGVEQINTYDGRSKKTFLDNCKKMKFAYPYQNISFAFHEIEAYAEFLMKE